jgi:methylase of polypeptide subunit release factors
LVLEHGISQGQDVAQLLQAQGFDSIRTYSDFSGRPRVTLGIHKQH